MQEYLLALLKDVPENLPLQLGLSILILKLLIEF
jgi:hypothetical protein